MVFNESLNLTVLGGWKISFKISSFECVKLYWNSAEFDGFSRSKTPKFLLLANHGGRHFAKFYASFRKILATPHFCKKIAQIINMLLLFLSKDNIFELRCPGQKCFIGSRDISRSFPEQNWGLTVKVNWKATAIKW